jgi:hypothetical protein
MHVWKCMQRVGEFAHPGIVSGTPQDSLQKRFLPSLALLPVAASTVLAVHALIVLHQIG